MEEESKRFADDQEVMSSDEEQDRIDEEKERFTATLTLNGITGQVKNVLVCAAGNAQALTKILFDTKLTDVGKAEVTQQEKTKDVLKIFFV